MRGSRLYKERDGVVYDTYTASLIFPGQAMLMQYLAVTPEGRYFVAMIASVSRFGHAIFPQTRRGAVEFAIKRKASDGILQDIGVTIQSPPESDDPYHLQHCLLHPGEAGGFRAGTGSCKTMTAGTSR